MRNKKLALNTASSLIFQVCTIICGFIIPRLILKSYGSEINGLVTSITQFLSVISFLEFGVGAVVQSSLYKPLAEKNYLKISEIIASAGKFFKRLAMILLIYIVCLMLLYPFVAKQSYNWFYTAALIAAIGISSFAQYYFGVVDRLLLTADQHGYVQYIAQTLTLIANTAACVVLIKAGASIHIVKLTTSLIYLVRPVILRVYVNRYYQINRRIKYVGEPIKQKWSGVAQHIAAIVLDGTDVIVLTVFSSMSNVSIYSVYSTVIYGVKQLFISMTNGMQSLVGELWAKKELDELNITFGWIEWIIHTGAVFIFGCTAILLVPFVKVYTAGINDADYIQPLFAIILTLAHAGHCLRLPYSIMILAGGHYRETQSKYIIAACINIIVSVATVKLWGLIGVAIGTLCATFFHTIWMSYYVSKNLICWEFNKFLKQIATDILTAVICVFATKWIQLGAIDYLSWTVMGIKVAVIWIIGILLINFIFYREKIKKLFRIVSNKNY